MKNELFCYMNNFLYMIKCNCKQTGGMYMKKIISIVLTLCIITAFIPAVMPVGVVHAETVTTEIYNETFEEVSNFTLIDAGAQKVLKKNGEAQWCFADSDDSFNEAFPAKESDLLTAPSNDGTNSKYANNNSISVDDVIITHTITEVAEAEVALSQTNSR